MPVSAKNSQIIYDALKACDITLFSALPETWLVHLIRLAEDDPEATLVRLAKEEEGVGISAGCHLAGEERHRRRDVCRPRFEAGEDQHAQRDERPAAGERDMRDGKGPLHN
jgi:hypothetical protein